MRHNLTKNGSKVTHNFTYKANYLGNPSEVSAALDIPRTTLNRYLDGTANPPDGIAAKVDELYNTMKLSMQRMPSIIAAIVANDFPQGIPSERSE